MTGLRIAPTLELPLDAVTETFGILAKKGAGKSNAAVVMAEEMYDAGVPWVAIDPKGDWWGLRAAGDGRGPGLPIIVFGGRHGDVPLEPTAGALLADLVLEQRLTCVLDVSEFIDSDVSRFLRAFAERLYRQATDDPIHLFLEEAHEYLPQMVRGDTAHLVHAWQRIVKQGRFKGIGCTLVSQRSAALNKDVLTQVDTLIVLRTTSPQDRAAVKAWVDVHADAGDMLATLPSLESGEAWLWSPEFLGKLERIRFRRRRTFDSGATPKVGQKRKPPATLADVDLDAIATQMAATIEKAKAEDPRELNKRIRDLERDLAAAIADRPEPVEIRVEVPVLAPEIVDQLEAVLEPAAALLEEAQETLAKHRMWAEQQLEVARRPVPQVSLSGRRRPDTGATARAATPSPRPARSAASGSDLTAGQGTGTDEIKVGKTERNVLTVLATHGSSTHAQICVLAGYSTKASTVGVALSKLRKLGYVVGGQPIGTPVTPTDEGLDALGEYESLPHGADLVEYWRGRFGKTERAVLDAILSLHPEPASLVEVCEITGYSPTASTAGVAASKLRKVGVLDGWALSAEFAEAGEL